ncbi:MAG TPA: hypothetical protein VLA24_17795, partial [Pseudomonadales bacterium]|nr:hypothetical protein [Pseudomonadales bacterium]
GFVEVSATNMPGVYNFGIPDAAIAAGAQWVIIMLKGATNMAPVVLEIELTAINNQDSVRGGMTALPNAAAAATGGLAVVDAAGAVKVQSGTAANQISLSSGLVTLAGVTHTGAVIPTVTTTTTATNLTNAPTNGDLTAAMKASVNTEVLDVLTVDTFAESSGVPAATASLKDKITWLATLFRNKMTQTATTQTLRNDADDGSIATSTTSDSAGTFTRGEWI